MTHQQPPPSHDNSAPSSSHPSSINPDEIEKNYVSNQQQQQQEQLDNSSESAGLARGAIRTATSISKRAAAGRLPTALRPNRLRIQRVARVSDRISTGFDAASSAIDTQSTTSGGGGGDGGKSRRLWGEMKGYARRGIAFSGNLAKHTILGAAVFESYEQSIKWLDLNVSSSLQTEGTFTLGGDVGARTSIPLHILAGAGAGTVHSILTLAAQSLQSFHTSFTAGTMRTTSFLPPNITHHVMHHATAHAILFGTYECTKRILVPIVCNSSAVSTINESHPTFTAIGNNNNDNNNNSNNMFYREMMAVGIAGGIAGQAQHIVSHVTETRWDINGERVMQGCHNKKGGGGANSSVNATLETNVGIGIRNRMQTMVRLMPSFRSILIAFPPSAIGFVAYEYGKELVSFD